MYQPINGWTKTRIIDHIKTNFKGQAKNGTICQYKTEDGKKCAVGLFIPDEVYHIDMESRAVINLMEYNPKLINFMPLPVNALGLLQNVHDAYLNSESGDLRPESQVLPDILAWVEKNVSE